MRLPSKFRFLYVWLYLISLWLTVHSSFAKIPLTKCYDADTDKIFRTSETIALNASLETRLPQITATEKGFTNMTWVPAPPQTTLENEKIGSFQGHEIHRIIYRTKEQRPDGAGPGILCVVFAYQGTEGLLPFFVRTEDIRWFESYFTADKTQPFGLLISITREGNGIATTDYNFAFTQREARITERSESGRHMRPKFYDYNSAGKVVRTSTADHE